MATRLCLSSLTRMCHSGGLKQVLNQTAVPQYFVIAKRQFATSPAAFQLLFSEKHEWIQIENGVGTVGVSHYAQEALGDIVFAQLPEMDADLEADEDCGALESVKAASEIYVPMSGTVVAINDALTDNPGLINASPYDEGWLFKIKVSNEGEAESLMDTKAYDDFLASQ